MFMKRFFICEFICYHLLPFILLGYSSFVLQFFLKSPFILMETGSYYYFFNISCISFTVFTCCFHFSYFFNVNIFSPLKKYFM